MFASGTRTSFRTISPGGARAQAHLAVHRGRLEALHAALDDEAADEAASPSSTLAHTTAIVAMGET
jgi:hypothetical protein